ncbi:TolB protein precursor [Desulfocucumis palustris]|uniref:TolB protein n=1 Tax=Desulfocucumis palustris TaxID=1898651 RepID=A0A2L2XF83_9FIRM|nr:TolB protein precursor [Desulfocucumis palustris]
MAPARSLAAALQAHVDWDSATGTATVTKGSDTIQLVYGSGEAIKNSRRVTLDVPVQMAGDRLMVPLRFVSEALHASVQYSLLNDTVTVISSPPEKPVLEYNSSFPARVALTNNGDLWLVDGTKPGSGPVQVTRGGTAEIEGWSPDGRWLMYRYSESSKDYDDTYYLWAVKADGTGAFQIDPKRVHGTPAWSPKTNIIAYSTQSSKEGYEPDGNLKLAFLDGTDNEKTTTSLLLPDNSGVDCFSWAPDGKSLAVSIPRSQKQPLLINRVDLNGESANLLTDGQPYPAGEYQYLLNRSATGLKWSPDGRYLAYYMEPGSASMTADGVNIQVLDLKQTEPPLELGSGLGYAQWLAWSPDSTRLAYIRGYGRDAAVDKRLYIADMQAGGKIIDCGGAGQVDSQPVWSLTKPYGLLFCRGKENNWMSGTSNFQGKVLVPGQRIWSMTADGEKKSLTSGQADTADYAPRLSPDGSNLFYLRLQRYDNGSLYYKPPAGGREVELIRGITGSPGFYGSYYPEMLCIYMVR